MDSKLSKSLHLLIVNCLAQDPEVRPSFEEIIKILTEI
jgi:hypothetical protein